MVFFWVLIDNNCEYTGCLFFAICRLTMDFILQLMLFFAHFGMYCYHIDFFHFESSKVMFWKPYDLISPAAYFLLVKLFFASCYYSQFMHNFAGEPCMVFVTQHSVRIFSWNFPFSLTCSNLVVFVRVTLFFYYCYWWSVE